MIWDIIKDKIETAGLATRGQSLFDGTFPADTPIGIGLFEPLGGIRVDPNLPDFYKCELRAIVRHNKIAEGTALAKSVAKLLTIKGEEIYPATAERGQVVLKQFFPLALPIRFPPLDGNGHEWSINFRAAFTLRES